jgi:hypothetical protein
MFSRNAMLMSVVIALAISLGVYFVWLRPVPHAHYVSPDGRFDVVTWTRPYHGWMPAMPGTGSDRPGWIEIVRRSDGRSCGELPVPMIWMATDVQWAAESAVLAGDNGGRWDLRTCTRGQDPRS